MPARRGSRKRRRKSSRRRAARGAREPRPKTSFPRSATTPCTPTGPAQVEEGLFSQTIEFGDISYQSAREENQQSVFAAMSELYDYFGSETSVQLTITNTPIPEREIGRKRFFEKSDPRVDEYVEEYNRILNDKMREGVSNLVRHRYLTFLVGADDLDAAAPRLARARGDCMQTLARIRCEARMLDGAERLELVQSQLRPKAEFTFSWDKLSQLSGLRTKDLIAPSVLDFKPDGRADCYRADGTWCRVLVFRGFGSDLEDDCIANVVDLPMPLNVTLHIHPMGKAAAVAYVKKRIAWMDKEVIDEQMSAVKKGYDFSILPPELSHSKEEAEELLDQLQNKNQRLFTYTGLVFTYADTAEALDHQTRQIMAAARQRSIEVEPLSYRQRQGMNSILPLGLNHVEVSRYMTTAQIVIQMPFASQELNQEGGGYYGQSKQSGNLVICNRKKLASPMGFVCGKPGSGKSFSVKREIMNTILAYPDDEVIVFDPAVSATAKSAERATLSRRRRPRFPAGGATALWPPALPRAAAQGALDRGVVEVRGPDLNLQRRGALGVPGRDRPARDLPSAELREPDRHRDVLCAERGQPPRGVRGPHDCPLSGSPSPSAASASRSFMR